MVWPVLATIASGAIQAGATIYGANQQAGAIASANAQQAANTRAQQGLANQQMELARPLVQTRDNALNLLNTLFGLPTVAPSLQRSQANGTALVPIPNTTYKTRADGGPDAQTQAFFDPVNRTIVGGSGELLANLPEGGGTIDRLVNGKNNPVKVDANGNLVAVTSSAGDVPLFQLPDQPEVPQAGDGASMPLGSRDETINQLLDLPGFEFTRQQGEQGIERALAARGLRGSGQGLKALTEFNNNLAATRFSDFVLNPLFQLAGFGNTGTGLASNSLTNLASATSQGNNNLSTLALLQGQNRASAFQNLGDIAGNTLGDIVSLMGRGGQDAGSGDSSNKTSGNKLIPKVI